MGLRVRFLPVVIFVAILMFSAKIGSIIHTFSTLGSSKADSGQEAVAAPLTTNSLQNTSDSSRAPLVSAIRSDDAPPSLLIAQGADNARNGFPQILNESATQNQGNDETPPPRGYRPATTVEGESANDIGDLSNLSPSEIRLLFSLADRRRQIINREREIIERESLLRAVENQLEVKQQRLSKIQGDIEALLKRYDARKDEENERLRSIYSSMKPKAAALIFNNLETSTLIEVLDGMSPRILAPIIAAMNVDKARQLTQILAERRIFQTTPDAVASSQQNTP